jgi:exopolysaccharide biosynthesis polyprenyl glycosylphosphotransferase
MSGYKFYNLAIMTGAFLLAGILTNPAVRTESFSAYLQMKLEVGNFLILLLMLIVWHLIFTASHVYQSRRFESYWSNEVVDVFIATTIGTLAIGVFALLFRLEIVTMEFLFAVWFIATSVSIASRILFRYLLKEVRKQGRNLNHILIVGTNPRAMQIAKKIENNKGLGYHLVGFVDDGWWSHDVREEGGYCRVTDLGGIADYLKSHVVDEVIICIPIKSLYDTSTSIIEQCQTQGIVVRVVTDAFKPKTGHSYIGQFEGNHVVTLNTGALTTLDGFFKRIIDFLISLILLIILSPLMLVIAVLIRLTSPGPVVFTQKRIGLNKRIFNIYKFRTMVINAEEMMADLEEKNEVSGPVFKIRNDPRITPVGSFLRKTSLDELPQLINVFKGDMSLVGPRPLPLRDYEGFNQDWHRRRFSVPPGITCLWQVKGRNSVPFEKWMELDMEYIDNWTFWLDIKILFKTVLVVLKGTGAS